jgi:hypothetical protein
MDEWVFCGFEAVYAYKSLEEETCCSILALSLEHSP